MTVTVASFRSNHDREFGDETVDGYPDESIQYWIQIAGLMMLSNVWGGFDSKPETIQGNNMTQKGFGTELFVAHNLVLERQAAKAASAGGAPGIMSGPVSSKSVGPGSISYDTNAGIVADAGHWNLTVYGTRFIQLAKMLGSVPVLVGVGIAPPFSGAGGAWPGPWPFPEQGNTGFG